MPQVRVIPPLPEQVKKIRVAAYARVSSNSADQLNSFITQVEYYAQYIQSKYAWEFGCLAIKVYSFCVPSPATIVSLNGVDKSLAPVNEG